MAKQKPKKRTNKEIVNAIIDLSQKIQHSIEYTSHVDKIFGLYLDFENKRELFSSYIDETVKKEKNEQKANGKADPKDLPADPRDEGSRTEGVREEQK